MKKLKLAMLLVVALMLTNCKETPPPQQEPLIEQHQEIAHYKLYSTNNMWTLLKLDTRNGKIWQVQFSVNGDEYRFEAPLNTSPLISNENQSDRFELYSTQNMYNFILLDKIDGKTWQVQWSTEPENRTIIPIK